jgi:cytochrome c-type biogenesis protein CcmF
MMVPWTFLTVGIVLGGWWSYAVLGWGGAWAWDPVENASFHPWLTGTAFLHSAMVLERRGHLRDWTLVLGMSTFLLTLVGTFMTRSGVFNSVHSFTQSDIGPVFLAFIAIVLVFSVVLLALRSHALDEAALTLDARLGARPKKPDSGIGALLSRDAAILAQNALFAVFTFVVLLGTLYPLIAEAMEERRVSVGEPYFDRWALPIGLVLVFLMGVGPALPWGRSTPERAGKRLAVPATVGLLLAGIASVAGYTGTWSLVALFVIGFALAGNVGEMVIPIQARMRSKNEALPLAAVTVFKRARRRFGGHIAHYGVLMAVFALAMTKGYRTEADYALKTGETAVFAGYDITFDGARNEKLDHRTSHVADFQIGSDGTQITELSPRMNFYPMRREPIFSPAVHSTPMGDLYLSLIEIDPDGKRAVLRVIHQPYQVWLWVSAPVVALGAMIALVPAGRRRRKESPVAESTEDAA